MLPFLSVLYFLCDNFIFTRWRFIQPQIIRCCLGCSGMKVGGWKLQTRPSFDQSSLEEISRFLVKTCLYGRCFLLKQAVPFVTGFCAFQTDGTLMEFCDFFCLNDMSSIWQGHFTCLNKLPWLQDQLLFAAVS